MFLIYIYPVFLEIISTSILIIIFLTVKGLSTRLKNTNIFIKNMYRQESLIDPFRFLKMLDIDNVDADYTSGVLSISVPTYENKKPTAKKITVN